MPDKPARSSECSEHEETKRLLGADHQHDLEVIEAVGDNSPGDLRVVRWCTLCGAVVVDVDSQGTTHPGAVASMRFPSFLNDLKCLPS